MLAAHIDRHRVSGLIGTIAGDDTIFAAVRSAKDQASVVKQVMSLVAMRLGEG
jgi:arginine repressor